MVPGNRYRLTEQFFHRNNGWMLLAGTIVECLSRDMHRQTHCWVRPVGSDIAVRLRDKGTGYEFTGSADA